MDDRALEQVRTQPPAHVPRRLPSARLGGAMAAWLGGVFTLCYVAIPIALALTGLSAGSVVMLPFALWGFGAAAATAILLAVIARPAIRLGGPRDPVIAATLGGLGAWAFVHNTSPVLAPFASMEPMHLGVFLAANLVEMALLGMLFASFTRRRTVAFGLGAGFQLASLWATLAVLG